MLFFLYDIVNNQNQLVMFTSVVSIFCVRQLTRHSNWIKVYVKPVAQHAQCKISVENSNFLLDDFLFFYLKLCLKNLRGAKIKPFSSVISIFFHLDFGLKFKNWHCKNPS